MFRCTAALLTTLIAVPGVFAESSVNKSIRVPDGETRRDGASSVNGSVTVGENCTIDGDCTTVNGSLRIGRHSRVEALSTVNGNMDIAEGAQIEDGVHSVNGSMDFEAGATIGDAIETVNGDIRLMGAEARADISTVNGEVRLSEGARVRGDIVVERKRNRLSKRPGRLEIVLEDESIVEGDIVLKDDDVNVYVIIRDTSRVEGTIDSRAKVERP